MKKSKSQQWREEIGIDEMKSYVTISKAWLLKVSPKKLYVSMYFATICGM